MLSFVKRFLGGKPSFVLTQSATEAATGAKPAVLLSVALHSSAGLEAMVSALIEQFKTQRMISPAETDLLLISVSGPCDAARFLEKWRDSVARDQIAAVFMQRMTKADVRFTETGSIHSLLVSPNIS